jgi:hypothetical protein
MNNSKNNSITNLQDNSTNNLQDNPTNKYKLQDNLSINSDENVRDSMINYGTVTGTRKIWPLDELNPSRKLIRELQKKELELKCENDSLPTLPFPDSNNINYTSTGSLYSQISAQISNSASTNTSVPDILERLKSFSIYSHSSAKETIVSGVTDIDKITKTYIKNDSYDNFLEVLDTIDDTSIILKSLILPFFTTYFKNNKLISNFILIFIIFLIKIILSSLDLSIFTIGFFFIDNLSSNNIIYF